MFYILPIIIIVADQLSKIWIKNNMLLETHIDFGCPYFSFYYIHNDGAAFSILKGKQSLLVLFTIAAMIAIIVYYILDRKKLSGFETFSLALILGGGIGNLIDRIVYSYVIDFINVDLSFIPNFSFPTFNVADIAISCGCILLIIAVLFPSIKHGKRSN